MIALYFVVDFIHKAKENPKRTVSMITDLKQVTSACTNLQDLLTCVLTYVDDVLVSHTRFCLNCKKPCSKAKQPESGDLCGDITEFGMAEGSPEPAGWRWSFRHPKRSDIAIQYTRRRLFCFYILLFSGFKSFQANIYEINMYLLLYFIF